LSPEPQFVQKFDPSPTGFPQYLQNRIADAVCTDSAGTAIGSITSGCCNLDLLCAVWTILCAVPHCTTMVQTSPTIHQPIKRSEMVVMNANMSYTP
jgi:hypothetical protein